jgi:hypothetical protein
MFAQNAVYGSTTVGGHEGIDAITAMMDAFFGKFPNVNWQVEEYVVSKVALHLHETLCCSATQQSGCPSSKFQMTNGSDMCPLFQDHPNCIEFLFTRTGVTNAERKNTRQYGKEWVCFTSAGASKIAISRVIVETFKTEILDDS